MLNPIPISIPEGPKSDCITKEVQDLLLDDAIEQVLPNCYSKRVFYSNVFTVPKPGTTLRRPVIDFKRLNTYINIQSFKMEGIKNLPSMVKQGYYMVKLDIKKAYLHVLVDPQYRDLFRFVWKGSHYSWKTMPFGLSTAPRIFTMLLRPVLRMLRDINVSVIAYLDDLLIVGSTKEECLSNLKKTMGVLVKLGFKLNLEKSVLEPTQSITFLGLQIDSVSMKLLFISLSSHVSSSTGNISIGIDQILSIVFKGSKRNDIRQYHRTSAPLIIVIRSAHICILLNFPSNYQVNISPFGTTEGISVSFNYKKNDTDFPRIIQLNHLIFYIILSSI
ncbi:hypothetical protein ACTFIW_003319 [Dictyostelium discoideum]